MCPSSLLIRCVGALNDVSTLLKADWVTDFDAASAALSTGVAGADKSRKDVLIGLASLIQTVDRGHNAPPVCKLSMACSRGCGWIQTAVRGCGFVPSELDVACWIEIHA